MKDFKKYILILGMTTYAAIAYPEENLNYLNTQDTLSVFKIDSILHLVKEKRHQKKITGKDFSENYHYNKIDNKVYCVAVYKSGDIQTLTLYYFIKEELCKVVYQELKKSFKKNKNVYYFSSGQLINKEEQGILTPQDYNSFLADSEKFKSKVSDF